MPDLILAIYLDISVHARRLHNASMRDPYENVFSSNKETPIRVWNPEGDFLVSQAALTVNTLRPLLLIEHNELIVITGQQVGHFAS